MTLKVYEAICAITEDLSKVGIAKDRKNTQQGYNFRGIDDVYQALSPLLAKHRLCILPRVVSHEVAERQSKSGGILFYTTMRVEFDFISAEDGSKHTVVMVGEAMDSADKSSNKAQSAAYKYAAMQAFAIPTEGDNDADAQTHELAPKQQTPAAALTPRARATRVIEGVKGGYAKEAAADVASWPDEVRDAVWALLDEPTQAALSAKWPAA